MDRNNSEEVRRTLKSNVGLPLRIFNFSTKKLLSFDDIFTLYESEVKEKLGKGTSSLDQPETWQDILIPEALRYGFIAKSGDKYRTTDFGERCLKFLSTLVLLERKHLKELQKYWEMTGEK